MHRIKVEPFTISESVFGAHARADAFDEGVFVHILNESFHIDGFWLVSIYTFNRLL